MGKKSRIAGWVISVLIALLLIGPSAMGKFLDWEGKDEAFAQLGWNVSAMKIIGVVEVVVALLFITPRVGFIGAILLTGYLGGAASTHARVGDPPIMPIVLGVIAWVAYGMRNPAVFRMALGNDPARQVMP